MGFWGVTPVSMQHDGTTDLTDFSISSECSACKCQDCKAKNDGVINAINALTISIKEMASKSGVIPSKRISYPYTVLEIKAAKRRKKDTSKVSSSIKKSKITTPLSLSCTVVQCARATGEQHMPKKMNVHHLFQQTKRGCGLFIAAYAEYLSNGLQVPNDRLNVGLLRKRYAALLWKYRGAKAQKPYTSDIKDPRRSKQNSAAPDEEQLVHIE
ncbi:hypothetical protein BC332_24144 [Capsicum chinense]|nr:hypothetical protein BC332_24144 [Capsicum chinense]